MPESFFVKKETLPRLFSCEFCEITKNTFCYRTPLMAASVDYLAISTDEDSIQKNTLHKNEVFHEGFLQ